MKIRIPNSSFVWLHRILDLGFPLITIFALTIIFSVEWHDRYLGAGIIAGLVLIIANQFVGVYQGWRGRSLLSGFKLVLIAWIIVWTGLIILAFAFKDSAIFSRAVILSWAFITPVFLILYRFILRLILSTVFSKGWKTKKVAIVGTGDAAKTLAKLFDKNKWLGYTFYGYFDDMKESSSTTTEKFEDLQSLISKAKSKEFNEVFITLPIGEEENIIKLLNELSDTAVIVKYIPDIISFGLIHAKLSDIGGMPVISIYDTPLSDPGAAGIKRIEDILFSTIILILVSPLMLILALGVKLSSSGPIFYKQIRIGWNGKEFEMLKFRSMPVDIEKNGVKWGESKNKTNTSFGSFIRRTSLDELPQFFNVLKGDMSIVGPRPERDIFVDEFRKKIPRYMQKHLVKAGITGWAQINGWRGDTDLTKRIEYDLYYIDNWSLFLDLKIILLTIVKGLINKNAY